MLGYDCTNCGYQRDCNVDSSGERICPTCEDAVTGITGRAERNANQWTITYRTQDRDTDSVEVSASNPEQAYQRAKNKADNIRTVQEMNAR